MTRVKRVKVIVRRMRREMVRMRRVKVRRRTRAKAERAIKW